MQFKNIDEKEALELDPVFVEASKPSKKIRHWEVVEEQLKFVDVHHSGKLAVHPVSDVVGDCLEKAFQTLPKKARKHRRIWKFGSKKMTKFSIVRMKDVSVVARSRFIFHKTRFVFGLFLCVEHS